MCEENVFYSCCLLHVACCFLCVEKQGVLLVFRRGFKLPSQVLSSSPLEAPLRRPPFSRGLEKGLEAPFRELGDPPSQAPLEAPSQAPLQAPLRSPLQAPEKPPLLKPPSSPPSTLQPSALPPPSPPRGRGRLKPPSRSPPFSSPPSPNYDGACPHVPFMQFNLVIARRASNDSLLSCRLCQVPVMVCILFFCRTSSQEVPLSSSTHTRPP